MGPGCPGEEARQLSSAAFLHAPKTPAHFLVLGSQGERVLLGTRCVCHRVCKARVDLTGVVRPS